MKLFFNYKLRFEICQEKTFLNIETFSGIKIVVLIEGRRKEEKMKKIIALVFCCVLLAGVSTVNVSANDDYGISLCYNNVMFTNSIFDISETGTANISINYFGYPGITTGATITTKLQKQNGTSWDDVEEWREEAIGDMFSEEYSIRLTERGTYRVQIEYVIYGSGGSGDVIDEEFLRTY